MTPGHLDYTDLGATVYPSHVPADLAEELPGRHSSLSSTVEWFSTQDRVTAQGACTLAQPRHVLPFKLENGTVEILNMAFRIAPVDARRACAALFRAFSHVHRVHLEVMLPPHELGLPTRVPYHADRQFIGLPPTVEDYRAPLGHTRRRLNRLQNRLSRESPDVATRVFVVGERSDRATRLSVFPAERDDRPYSLRETGDVARRTIRAKGETIYWSTRRAIGEHAKRLPTLGPREEAT